MKKTALIAIAILTTSMAYAQPNVYLGLDAGLNNTTGDDNVFVGGYAGLNNTIGSDNVYVGARAGRSGINAYHNVFIGTEAGDLNTTGSSNVFVGYRSGASNTWGYENAFLGVGAGASNTTGYHNTFSGYQAGALNSTGYANVYTGYRAAFNSTTGFHNTFTGYRSGYSNTTGAESVYMGFESGLSNTSGYQNIFIGNYAGYSNTTGRNNVFVGYAAASNSVSQYNTAIGFEAGKTNTTGYNNTYLGFRADADNTGYIHTSALGNWAQVTGSNMVRIGDQMFTGSIGGWQSWTTLPSDERAKKNVQSNVPGLDFIKKLRPVTYNVDYDAIQKLLRTQGTNELMQEEQQYLEKAAKEVYTGFIAQEVEAAAKELGFQFSGVDAPENEHDLYGLRYAEFTVPLVKAVQEVAEENASLKKQNSDMLSLIDALSTRLQALEKAPEEKSSGTSIQNNTAWLAQNAPNPFTDNTVIRYFIPESKDAASISITSDNGTEVMNLPIVQKGNGSITVSGHKLQPGTYACMLIINGKAVDVKKMIMVK